MKIELTYEINPNWLNDKAPVFIEVKDREKDEWRVRKKRSVRNKDSVDDLELALRIPARYIVVVVSQGRVYNINKKSKCMSGPKGSSGACRLCFTMEPLMCHTTGIKIVCVL